MIRRALLLGIIASSFVGGAAFPAEPDRVTKIEAIKDMFQTGDFFIGGQPSLETLRWLKSQGVTLVVNLRMESENREFATASYNEENLAKEMGLTYSPIPVGDKDSYSPKTLDRLAQAIKANNGKTLIHCATGVRATHLWMAYLVHYRACRLNDAVAVGKQMKFTLPLEDFLGARISMTLDEAAK